MAFLTSFVIVWAVTMAVVFLFFIGMDQWTGEGDYIQEAHPFWVQLIGNGGIALVLTFLFFIIQALF